MSKKFQGTVQFSDLEGGIWQLACSDGKTYQLSTDQDELKVRGLKVEVQGSVAKDMMGIGMTGPILQVKSWKSL